METIFRSHRLGLSLGVLALLIVLGLALHLSAIPARAQGPLLIENFDYGGTAGNLTTVSGGNWAAHSGTGYPVQYIITSLSMPGYGSSGVGGAATFANGSGSREDVNRTFVTQSSGVVYYAALVKLSAADTTGNYFLHLKDATTGFRARIFARDSGSGQLRFGFSNTSTGAYATDDFAYNTTYLLVAKFDTTNGNAALYVLDAYSATEPDTPLLTATGTGLGIQAIAIRQDAGALTGVIDGIRVANTWADAVGSAPAFSITKSPSAAMVQTHAVLTYTIRVENTGVITTATNVVITDALPAGTTWAWGGSYADGIVSFTTPSTIGVGSAISVTFAVTVDAPMGATIVNDSYGVRCAEVPTPTLGAPVTVTVSALDLVVSKAGPQIAFAGESLVYTITIQNQGVTTATNVVLTDTLPISVTYAADDSGVTPTNPTPGVYVWSFGDVPADTTRTFHLTATLDAGIATGTVLTNQAEASTDTVGDNPANNTAQWNTTVYQVVPIATARAGSTGQVFAIEGRVIYVPGTYQATGWGLQDASGGIAAYYSPAPTVALGDQVRLVATLGAYYNEEQMSAPVYYFAHLGAGPEVDPRPQDTGDIATGATEGWLVVVTGTVSGLGSCAGNYSFYVDDGSGAAYIYVDQDTGVNVCTMGIANGDNVRIVGFSTQYQTTYEVKPRRPADVAEVDATPPTVVATTPTSGATGVSPHKSISATFSEALKPSTVNTSTFLLAGPGGAVAGVVTYDGASFKATFTPGAPLAANSPHTATLTAGIQDVAGNPLAAPYTWTFTTGDLDTTPPFIVGRAPAPDETGVAVSANVVITFSEELDPATVTPANVYLTGPYGPVPAALSYNAGSWAVTLDPASSLLPTTRYTVTVKAAVADWAGLTLGADAVWSFQTAVAPPMNVYHGDLHNHTAYSDGTGTPAQALAAGRAAGFDFMAITDHSYAIADGEWADTLSAVNTATVPGQFVALRGFEYTQGAEGHANVYNTVRHATRSQVAGCAYCDYTPNLERGVTVEGFYHWLEVTGTQALDGAGTIMQFNHPGWINFNDWAFHPEVSDTARLEEVGNGSGVSYVFSEDEYIRSLDYGWRVGATNNADTHTDNWGVNTDHRTGVWMPNLTKSDLLEALRARRTFASEDKNYALRLKGNGFWMGSEIANTGQIVFDIYGSDPDGEPTALVQLITNGGRVIAQTAPGAATFTWQPVLTIAPGVHYYYVKAIQADGDRIVTSPIWTQGTEDISISDLTVQPSIPTIYNPSLLTARVTNRGQTTQTVTVTFQAGATVIGVVPVTVDTCAAGPCADGYANVSWQPATTGPVTITAALSGAPAADNPDDNSRSLALNVTDEKIPLILIDNGHGNVGAAPRDARLFANDLTDHGYNVLFNLDEITPSDLNTETVKLLIINAYGPADLTSAEKQAIADFVAAGGSLWLNGISDYTGKVPWANTAANRQNSLVGAIEARTGVHIPIRFNDDEVLDGNDNNGYPWGVQWHIYPVSYTTGVGVNVTRIQSWSDASLIDRSGSALTASDLGDHGFMFIVGDLDAGTGTYGYPNRTSNTDADSQGDAYIYPDTIPLAGAAGYDIPGAPGRLFFYGDSNDPFNVFAYTAGDGKQNELFNLQVVMWLLGTPLQKSTIAQARADAGLDNTPDRLDELVWVEGQITAGYGEFFNVLYVQDETGGVTVHAPAGDIYASDYVRGAYVRVVGTVGIYNGDTEIEFFEAEQVQVLTPTTGVEPLPIPMSTYNASLEANEGWLVQITGTVTAKIGSSAIIVDDGSGPVRAFLDGYNGDFNDIGVLDIVTVKGLVSEDGDGRRIRVRNHGAHPALPDDVLIILRRPDLVGSTKTVAPTTGVQPGDTLTYTIHLVNATGSASTTAILTDTLPAEVQVVTATLPAGMTYHAGSHTLTWSGLVASDEPKDLVFQVRVLGAAALSPGTHTFHNRVDINDGFGYVLTRQSADTTVTVYRLFLPVVMKN